MADVHANTERNTTRGQSVWDEKILFKFDQNSYVLIKMASSWGREEEMPMKEMSRLFASRMENQNVHHYFLKFDDTVVNFYLGLSKKKK